MNLGTVSAEASRTRVYPLPRGETMNASETELRRRYGEGLILVAEKADFVPSIPERLAEGGEAVAMLRGQPGFGAMLRFCKWTRLFWSAAQDASLTMGQRFFGELLRDSLIAQRSLVKEGLQVASKASGWNYANNEQRLLVQHYYKSIALRDRLMAVLIHEGVTAVFDALGEQSGRKKIRPPAVGLHLKKQELVSSVQGQVCIGLLSEGFRLLSHKLLFFNVELKNEKGPFGESSKDHFGILVKAIRGVETLFQAADLSIEGKQVAAFNPYLVKLRAKLLPQCYIRLVEPLSHLVAENSGEEMPASGEAGAKALLHRLARGASELQAEAETSRAEVAELLPAEFRHAQEQLGLIPDRWLLPSGVPLSERGAVFGDIVPRGGEVNKVSSRLEFHQGYSGSTQIEVSEDPAASFQPSSLLVELVEQATDNPPPEEVEASREFYKHPWHHVDTRDPGTFIQDSVEGLLADLARRVLTNEATIIRLSNQGRFNTDLCDEFNYRLGLDRYHPGKVYVQLYEELVQFAQASARKRPWGYVFYDGELNLLVQIRPADFDIDLDAIDEKHWTRIG